MRGYYDQLRIRSPTLDSLDDPDALAVCLGALAAELEGVAVAVRLGGGSRAPEKGSRIYKISPS